MSVLSQGAVEVTPRLRIHCSVPYLDPVDPETKLIYQLLCTVNGMTAIKGVNC